MSDDLLEGPVVMGANEARTLLWQAAMVSTRSIRRWLNRWRPQWEASVCARAGRG